MRLIDRHNPWSAVLGAPLGVAAALILAGIYRLPAYHAALLAAHPELQVPFLLAGSEAAVLGLVRAGWVCVAVCSIASFAGLLVRRGWALRMVRLGYAACNVLFIGLSLLVFKITSLILEQNITVAGRAPDNVALFAWRWDHLWQAGAVALVCAALYVVSWRRPVIRLYTGVQPPQPVWGDRFVENLRSHGPDPVFRKSMWSSIAAHLFVIIIIPWLIAMHGSESR